MSFKLNHLEIQPDYDAHKDFKISVGKNYDYQTIQGGFPLAQVRNVDPDRVSISFPLARETASAGITLQNQVRELVKNPEVGEVYLNWSGATHLNGHYALDSADISIPTGGIDGGYADFSAKLTKIGEKERVQRALQMNRVVRSPSTYGTVGVQSAHAFPFASSVFSTSGVFNNRVGSLGDIPWARNATHQDLFPYEQDSGSIGLGDVRVYDDMGDAATRANWVEVFGPDHKFTGDAVLENTLLQVFTRKTFTADIPGGLTLKYWNTDDTDYAVAGTASFVEIDGVNYGTTVPKISIKKINAEGADLVMSYPPSANSLKVKLELKRGKWDVIAKPDMITGTVPTNLVARLGVGTYNTQVVADTAVNTDTKADGTHAILTGTSNYFTSKDAGITSPHFGILKTGTRSYNNFYQVTSSKVTEINMATGTEVMSFLATGTGPDSAANQALQLRYVTEELNQVVER